MMPRLTLKNCSSNQYVSLHPQYPRLKKKIQRKLKGSQSLTPSTRTLFLASTILLLAVSLL
jgi:hypothetical protein